MDYKETIDHIGEETLKKRKSLEDAALGTRFINFLLDTLFYYALFFLWAFFIGLILGLIAPNWLNDNSHLLESPFINYILGFISTFVYYVTFEYLFGQSIGKLFTNTKVVTEDGEKPDFGTIALRTCCRFIPFEPLSFFGSKPNGWHDTISKTRVVKKNKN